MNKSEMVSYIVDEYLPVSMAVPTSVVTKQVEEAIRWFDREGADIRLQTFPYGGTVVKELPSYVDIVMEVYPSNVVTELFTAQTLLLGVTILDYDLEVLVPKFAHLSTLRTFLSSKFRWKWVKPNLYIGGTTTDFGFITVQYMYHYDYTDATLDITGTSLDYVLRYAKAMTDIREGRARRLGSIIDAPVDGDTLVSEGAMELDRVKEELINKRRLVAISRSV